jgi:hypothetical protein
MAHPAALLRLSRSDSASDRSSGCSRAVPSSRETDKRAPRDRPHHRPGGAAPRRAGAGPRSGRDVSTARASPRHLTAVAAVSAAP